MTSTVITPLAAADRDILKAFTAQHAFIQRHLDWRVAEDWLGQQPFLLLTEDNEQAALLACPEDPPGVAWIRFFASRNAGRMREHFAMLLQHATQRFGQHQPTMAAVALHKWYETLLSGSGFETAQQIVVLEKKLTKPSYQAHDRAFRIKPMLREDLDQIETLDAACFDPLWRLSIKGLRAAFTQSTYSTRLEADGELIGYQISNINLPSAHLSRLAVLPAFRRRHLGSYLVNDLASYYHDAGATTLTVNTQDNNPDSLFLYRKLGFELMPEHFPVMVYHTVSA